jgi:2-oxopent-4-enoate/cis-2-oxohex-4-enoate hydratase
MDKKIITDLGDELYNALKNRQMIDPLSSRYPDMTVEDAYKVQERMIARRIEAGERIVGKKIGVTSRVVMNMLGVYRPDCGY